MATSAHRYGDKLSYMTVSDAELKASTKTATFQSDGINPGGCEWIGVYYNTAASGGTSPTLDITLQWSPDGGTTWTEYPDAADVDAQAGQATLPQETGNDNNTEYWRNIVPIRGSSDLNPQVRAVFTIGGTSPTFDITGCWIRVFRGA